MLSTGRGRNRCSESQRLWGPQYDGTTSWKISASSYDDSAAGDVAEGHHLGKASRTATNRQEFLLPLDGL